MKRAFSLIELLVVITIIAIFAGLLFSSGVFTKDRAELRVSEAARGVERVLLEARNLSINTGKTHAVVFHIANAGDGKVLRNSDVADARSFEGRHWCAIFGPALESDEIPRIKGGYFMGRPERYGTAQRFASTVELAQIGERYYLPRGARFLALGDAEDNLHSSATAGLPRSNPNAYMINDWSVSTPARTGIASLNTSYPRPWFGYLQGSGSSWTLYPWGGYDPTIIGSGLDYECSQRSGSQRNTITNSKNDQLCICGVVSSRTDRTPAKNNTLDEMRPCCDASQIGKERPLINGYWMDFTVVFLPNGKSRTMPFYNRMQLFSYASDVSTAGGRTFPTDTIHTYDNPLGNGNLNGRDDAIIVFEEQPLGGTVITVAKDARTDGVTYASPQEAWKALLPVRRVIVNNATGGVTVNEPYATIQRWLDTQERGIALSDRIWANGYEFCAANDAHPQKIRVTNALTPEMLQQHDPYPWIKPKP
jgi:prepilin-type N-terminal cleavage/methylation domain-containing protein